MSEDGKNAILTPKVSITEQDLAEVPGLKELRDTIEKIEQSAKTATGKNIISIAPLIDLKKEDVLKLAIELEVPLDYTWSCVLSDKTPCGSCASCIERKEAFEQLNIEDPIYNQEKKKKYE